MSTGEDWARQYIAEKADQDTVEKARLGRNKPVVVAKLKELGVKVVVATYSGSGDSGQVENVHALSIQISEDDVYSDWGPDKDLKKAIVDLETPRVTQEVFHGRIHEKGTWRDEVKTEEVSLREAIEAITYGLLEIGHAGWENNDGADGYLFMDVELDSVRLHHEQHYTQSDVSEMEL